MSHTWISCRFLYTFQNPAEFCCRTQGWQALVVHHDVRSKGIKGKVCYSHCWGRHLAPADIKIDWRNPAPVDMENFLQFFLLEFYMMCYLVLVLEFLPGILSQCIQKTIKSTLFGWTAPIVPRGQGQVRKMREMLEFPMPNHDSLAFLGILLCTWFWLAFWRFSSGIENDNITLELTKRDNSDRFSNFQNQARFFWVS